MLTLAIDTCLGACTAVLAKDGKIIVAASEPMARGHQERLAPMVREVSAGVGFADLDRIAVTVGPGSFTGLRVGLAFAKGLALAAERPLVGIGTLEALATGLPDAAAVIDAGRGRVYLQAFAAGAPLFTPMITPREAARERLAGLAAHGPLTIVGPGAHLFEGEIAGAVICELAAATPAALATLAEAADGPAAPLYLRPPDAKPKAP
jgi:tRNA threonylcarbamoyladenosine biosynthesis protein TsaB